LNKDDDVYRPAVGDFLDFRRKSIARFVAEASAMIKKNDSKAKRTYSSIGVLFSQFDRFSTSEDFKEISDHCDRIGAPLDFYSLNSYLNLNSRESFNLGLSTALVKGLTGKEAIFTEF